MEYLKLRLDFRGYYETTPDGVANDFSGYDEFSYLQEACGVGYSF